MLLPDIDTEKHFGIYFRNGLCEYGLFSVHESTAEEFSTLHSLHLQILLTILKKMWGN